MNISTRRICTRFISGLFAIVMFSFFIFFLIAIFGPTPSQFTIAQKAMDKHDECQTFGKHLFASKIGKSLVWDFNSGSIHETHDRLASPYSEGDGPITVFLVSSESESE